jgi:hypothetical protein
LIDFLGFSDQGESEAIYISSWGACNSLSADILPPAFYLGRAAEDVYQRSRTLTEGGTVRQTSSLCIRTSLPQAGSKTGTAQVIGHCLDMTTGRERENQVGRELRAALRGWLLLASSLRCPNGSLRVGCVLAKVRLCRTRPRTEPLRYRIQRPRQPEQRRLSLAIVTKALIAGQAACSSHVSEHACPLSNQSHGRWCHCGGVDQKVTAQTEQRKRVEIAADLLLFDLGINTFASSRASLAFSVPSATSRFTPPRPPFCFVSFVWQEPLDIGWAKESSTRSESSRDDQLQDR